MKKFSFLILLLVGVASNGIAQSVKIGTQEWTTKNLNVSTFRNGEPIPEAKTPEEWKKAGENKQPAWCYYDNDPQNGTKYGKLYNYYAVKDPRGLTPKGWHIPTDSAWGQLAKYLGGSETAGEKMKSTEGWPYDRNGSNSSGFSGLPGGFRDGRGEFRVLTIVGMWWGSSATNADNSKYCYLNANNGIFSKGVNMPDLSIYGLSVRCLKD
jgi:uncharacterized protein (TIGR02145 family)